MFKLNYAKKTVEREDGTVGSLDDRDPIYSEYLAWLSQGNTPEVVEGVTPRLPYVVSPAQARVALAQAGLLEAVELAVSQMSPSNPSRIAWEYALEFREDSPVLIQMCEDLGFTTEQTVALFEAAKGVQI